MRTHLAASIATLAAVTLSVPLAATASTSASYTDVSACRSIDLGPDEFAHNCSGPDGKAAVLYYFDGRAQPIFGPAGSENDMVSTDAAQALDAEPLIVGSGSKVFGAKIEWVAGGGSTCAGIIRVNTDRGSRLVVTTLGDVPKRVAVAQSNDEARAAAAKACGEDVASTGLGAGAATDPIKVSYENVPLTDPMAAQIWIDERADATPVGAYDPWAYQATVQAGGRTITISHLMSGTHCSVRECPSKAFEDGREIASFNSCSSTDFHEISSDGRTLMACGFEHRLY